VGDLLRLVRSVALGQAFASPQIVASMFRRLNQRSTVHPIAPARVLSSREREIVDMLEVGCSNKEIAAELKIRLPTVKKHVHSIFVKLQVTRRAQVAETLRRDRRRQWRVVQGSPEPAEASHFPTVLAGTSRFPTSSFGG
jgi:DNA-binding NarL/FixJ family response regulator